MQTRTLFLIASLIVLLQVVNAEERVHQHFVGKWSVESFQFAGYEIRGSEDAPMSIQFEEKSLIATPGIDFSWNWTFQVSAGTKIKQESNVRFQLDEQGKAKAYQLRGSATQGEIDIQVGVESDGQPRFAKGIYAVDDGLLEVCVGDPNTRPKTIAASKQAYVLKLKKLKSSE